jgi:hypothetical protein
MTERDLIVAVGLVVAYILVQNRTLRYAKPLRTEIEKKAKCLLQDPRVQWPVRESVEFMVDYTANPWVAPAAAIVGLVLALLVALRIVRLPEHEEFANEDIEQRYRYIDTQFTKSIVAANPIGGLLLLNASVLMITILAVSGLSWEIYDELKTKAGAATNKRLHNIHWMNRPA